MAITDYQTYVDAAVTAIAAEDWSTALTNLLAAKAAFLKVPDTDKDGFSARFRSGEIDALIAQVEEQISAGVATATGGWQRTRVTYVEATD